MPEEQKIPVAVIGIGLGLGVAAALAYYVVAQAAPPTPPPEEFICPYCGAALNTYEELVAHVQSVHPGERIPIDIIWD